MNLFPWQEPLLLEQTTKFQAHGVVLNALPTGVGKTYITAAMLQKLSNPVLVISPKSVIPAWKTVLSDAGVTADVINWEKLQTEKTTFYSNSRWTLKSDTILVVDEVHKGCSGPKTLCGRMLASTRAWKLPAVMMSATVADNPLKMRATGYLLGLHNYGPSEFHRWCMQHGCYKSPWHTGLEFPKGPAGRKHMLAIHAALEPKMVRRSLADIPGFPETFVEAELHRLDDKYENEMNRIYEEMKKDLKEPATNPLTIQLRARQQAERLKVPLLTDLVLEELEEDKSVVVFLCFRDSLSDLESRLARAGVKCATIHGGQTDAGTRATNIADFQENRKFVMLAMIQAGGLGVSLHDVKHERPRVALINPSFSAVEVVQALGRIHRAGGTKSVQRFILVSGTIEENVHRSIQRKLSNISALNDGDLEI